VNTHTDHASPIARERSAAQIVRFLRKPGVVHPVILGGDMNADPDSRPVQLLLGAEPVDGAPSVLRDSYHLSGGPGSGPPTFHGFTGRGEERIDYLLAEPPLRATRFEVLDQPVDGHWVSDHFPVLAALEG